MEVAIIRGLSANTLFHFTSSLENLVNILTTNCLIEKRQGFDREWW